MCFTVQLSRFLSFFLISDSFYIISKLFLFVKNFLTFFKVFYFDLLSFSATAIIEYHIFISLSTVFLLIFLFLKRNKKIRTEKEGFEPSHGANRLYPQQGHLFSHLSTSPCLIHISYLICTIQQCKIYYSIASFICQILLEFYFSSFFIFSIILVLTISAT